MCRGGMLCSAGTDWEKRMHRIYVAIKKIFLHLILIAVLRDQYCPNWL